MNLVQKLLERLRPFVNFKSWDYGVIWQLAEDQRFLEWMDCCCAGSENIDNGGEDLFPVSSVTHCRDVLFQHPRTNPCYLLAELPSSIPLDSGIYAEALMSNQARWLNFSNNSDSNPLEETVGTRVLIPIPIGIVELFVAKQVPEDHELIDYIATQFTILFEQQSMMDSTSCMDPNLSTNENNQIDHTNINPFLPSPENSNLPYEITADHRLIHQLNSPMHFAQPPFLDGSNCNEFQEMGSIGKHMGSSSLLNKETDNDLSKHEMGRSESMSDCSDGNEEGEDAKYRKRTGKGPQSKNLQAERRRRKKLNDRLYLLRSLVPNITKLDRASILGDAIDFVKELKKQERDLQLELEEQSEDDERTENNGRSEILNVGLKREHENSLSGNNMGEASNGVAEPTRQKDHDSGAYDQKPRQMEPRVEVAQLDGNKFFVQVFCEHKSGGFVRLMEALNSLCLEVTSVNVTSHTSLVSNVFQVEMMDSEMVQADYVRDSLLEITRFGGWPDQMAKSCKNKDGMDCHQHDHRGNRPNGLHNHQASSHNLRHLHH